ncbi:SPOR domain-containing protein, partial [Methylophaga sp. UBA1464]
PEPSPPPVSQPEPSTSADSASRWILQLGSFSVEANATSLKKQLEDIGYKPMIEQTRSGETVIYRVRLQPDADRATLERTAASIREQLNLNTQIFPYP